MKEPHPKKQIGNERFDEANLVDQVVAGSQSALRRLYALYGGLVYSIAFKVIEDKQEAEEITQDVFIKIWRVAKTYDAGKCSLKGWVSLIARTSSLDRLRKKNRRPDQLFRNMVDVQIGDFQNISEGNEEDNAKKSMLFENLATLRGEYRKSLELAYFKGYTQKEIGRAMSIPEGTAKTFLRRGLMKLREVFEAK